MLKALLIWAAYSITLPPPTCQNCFKVHERQCRNANFIPGYNLAGAGFDITTMERKRAYVIDMNTWLQKDKTCTLCQNPYMMMQEQKLPMSVVDWRATRTCQMKVSSSVYKSSEALVSSITSSIINNWEGDLGISNLRASRNLILAGSKSKLADYSMKKTKTDKFNFASHEVSCGFYSYSLMSHPPVQPELNEDFGKLPQRYDAHTRYIYFQLINKFGTHYFSKVTLGGKVRSVTSINECAATMQDLAAEEVKACLDVEASISMTGQVSAELQTAYNHCRNKKQNLLEKRDFSSIFNDRETDVIGGYTKSINLLFSANSDPKAYKEWFSSLPEHPEVISYTLESLHQLMPAENPRREHLRNAIKDYIIQRGLLKDCTAPCEAGIKSNPNEPCACSCHGYPGVAPNCCPTRKGLAHVTVTVIRASGLYGDTWTQADSYVKIFYKGDYVYRTDMITDNDTPYWNRKCYLGNGDLTHFQTVTLQVWDDDDSSDDLFGSEDELLGSCEIILKAGHYQDMWCALNHGVLFYNVEVECISSLTGPLCTEYIPSHMDAQLEKVYVSRHARPIPADMLMKMGVLLD